MPVVEDPGGDHLNQHQRHHDQQQRAAEHGLRQQPLDPAALANFESVRYRTAAELARLGWQRSGAVTPA